MYPGLSSLDASQAAGDDSASTRDDFTYPEMYQNDASAVVLKASYADELRLGKFLANGGAVATPAGIMYAPKQASAPLAGLGHLAGERSQKEAQRVARIAYNEVHARYEGKTCAVCKKLLSRGDELLPSLVVFGRCSHVVHLACVSAQLSTQKQYSESQWQESCAACVLRGTDADADETLRLQNVGARDPDTILRSFKTRFTRDSGGQSYDHLKTVEASDGVKLYILGATLQQQQSRVTAAASAALSSIAPRLKGLGSTIASRIKRTDNQLEEDEREKQRRDEEEHDGATPEDTLLRSAAFEDLMLAKGRTFDDVLSLEEGSLLQLYRCGIQSIDTLRELGFNPVLHIKGARTAAKVPVWQLHDLYGFTFEQLVDHEHEGGFGMTARDVCEMVSMLAPEWALIGATAHKLVALQMRVDGAAALQLPLHHWEKYLGLEPAHLQAIGITTRHDFVNVMNWDAKSPLCPKY